MELRKARVSTKIEDQVSTTRIEQEFCNPNSARLEGTFVFPIPPGAHLDRFAMEIDGKKVEAELVKAAKAREIYENIVRKSQDPALMEYAGNDLLKVRIFPLEPNGTKKVTISYTQLLKADRGLVALTLPLSAGRFSSAPPRDFSAHIELETKAPLKSVYSPTHNLETKRSGSHHATASFEADNSSFETDLVLYFAPEKDEVGLNLLTYHPAGEDGYFLLLASPGLQEEDRKVIPRDLIFVLDTSGSMAGKKLEQAPKALEFCIENLNEGDRFEIIRFATEIDTLFGEATEWTKSSRERARAFIRKMKPLGGTAIDDALKRALEASTESNTQRNIERPCSIIFLTDGRPTLGVTDESEILKNLQKRHKDRTRIFCFGIGTDVNTHLLDKISERTRGATTYVLPEEDLEVKVSSFYARIKDPVLANPALKLGDKVRLSKMHPGELPDLFLGEQLVLAGRYSGHGDTAIHLSGVIDGKTHQFTYEATFPERESDNEFIARLWATRRVGWLLDEIRLHGEEKELREEVTALAREYGIVTPYTSYLIVEDEAQRNVPARLRSFQNYDQDSAARRAGREAWSQYKSERVGDAAVFGARNSAMLRTAQASSAGVAGSVAESSRALGVTSFPRVTPRGASAPNENERLAQYAQQSRFVSGKNFFINNGVWQDAAVQTQVKPKPVRIAFGSDEYFELSRNHPEARPWLALGNQVQFLLAGTVYEIYDPAQEKQ
jgi:Ca-activated chloride channel family protein